MLRASTLGLVLRRPACPPVAPCAIHRTSLLVPPSPSEFTATFSTFRPAKAARAARSDILREPPPHTTASTSNLSPGVREPPPHIAPPERAVDSALDAGWDLDVLLPHHGRYDQKAPLTVKHRSPRPLPPQAALSRSRQRYADGFDDQCDPKQLSTRGSREQESALHPDILDLQSPTARTELLDILGRSHSLEEAWAAYHALLSLPAGPSLPPHAPVIPHTHLRRLGEMLASSRPYTRTSFLRLLSVLSSLHRSGHVRVEEWNALINYAGKGWRRIRLQDFQNAMDVYEDFVSGAPPGTTLNGGQNEELAFPTAQGRLESATWGHGQARRNRRGSPKGSPKPDIYTYTTLIDVACRTGHAPAVRHAMQLLKLSGLTPTRITHLILLNFFTHTHDLASVRDTLDKMRRHGHDIELDGMNGVIWAFVQNGHLDVAGWVYRVMRNNLVPEEVDPAGEGGIHEVVTYLDEQEGIVVPDGLVPDATTYTMLVQGYAYQGELSLALQVFMDMLTTPVQSGAKSESWPQSGARDSDEETSAYGPALPAFRALFLGFARHASTAASKFQLSEKASFSARMAQRRLAASGPSDWTEDQLFLLFKAFLALPSDARPSERLIYWILIAFDKATDHDVAKLRRVYQALEGRFGGRWGGRIERFRASIFPAVKGVERSGHGGG